MSKYISFALNEYGVDQSTIYFVNSRKKQQRRRLACCELVLEVVHTWRRLTVSRRLPVGLAAGPIRLSYV